MFDVFPDKIALQLMAAGIAGEFTKNTPIPIRRKEDFSAI